MGDRALVGMTEADTPQSRFDVYDVAMRTNIDIDERLLAHAQAIADTPTKKATVEHALRELIRRKDRQRVRELLGTVDWIGDLGQTRRGRPR